MLFRSNCLQSGEFVRAVRVPLPAGVVVHAWKVSKRLEQDISAVAVATAFRLTKGKVAAVRIGVGGMAAVPSRAPKTEAELLGLEVSEEGALATALQTLRNEFAPLDDLRASAAYRRQVAANLLQRSWLALQNATLPDAAGAVSSAASAATAASGAAPSTPSGRASSTHSAHSLADLSPILMEITP